MAQITQEQLSLLVQQLRLLHPPSRLVHVGSGLGLGGMHQWHAWTVPSALLVEAVAERSAWTESALKDHPGWCLSAEAIASADGEAEFFVASNPSESGLLSPELLKPLWPSLKTTETRKTPVRSLDSILGDHPTVGSPDWLLIDCLPALPVLQGAENALDGCGVIWLRAVLGEVPAPLAAAGLPEIKRYLAGLAFHCVAVAEGNHPSLGDALFVRDWRIWLGTRIRRLEDEAASLNEAYDAVNLSQFSIESERNALLKVKDEQDKAITSFTSDLEQLRLSLRKSDARIGQLEVDGTELVAERDKQAKLAAEASARAEQLRAERDALAQQAAEAEGLRQGWAGLEARLAELESEKAALAAERDAQAGRVAEASAWAEQLRAERDALAQQAAEAEGLRQGWVGLEARLAELESEKAALAAERDAQAGRVAEVSAGAEQLRIGLQQRDARIAQLEAEQAELSTRQRLFNEEMINADAQIELIKEMLLREPGL